MNMKY